ncbi:hypothetical protein AALA49_04260 [Streptococcus alactolyticus]|uniref:hypothetical protein n=1 Tax=Streptococcus alactolyticus TaxID=29389 RepID=UPI0035111D3F
MGNANYKREVIIYDLILDGNVVFTGTVNDIAEKLGISPVTVYTRQRKGIHVLQEKRRELRTLTRKLRQESEPRKIWIYQLFKCDEWLFTGTRKECAEFLGVRTKNLVAYEQKNGLRRVKLRMECVNSEDKEDETLEIKDVVSNKEDKERIRKYIKMKAAALCGL